MYSFTSMFTISDILLLLKMHTRKLFLEYLWIITWICSQDRTLYIYVMHNYSPFLRYRKPYNSALNLDLCHTQEYVICSARGYMRQRDQTSYPGVLDYISLQLLFNYRTYFELNFNKKMGKISNRRNDNWSDRAISQFVERDTNKICIDRPLLLWKDMCG